MSEPGLARRAFAPLGRLLEFEGRSAPADFWPYMLLLVAIYVVGFALMFAHVAYGIGSPVASMFALVAALIILAFAAVVRRLHDVGWSGRWMVAYVLMALCVVSFILYQRNQLTHGLYDPGKAVHEKKSIHRQASNRGIYSIFAWILCQIDRLI